MSDILIFLGAMIMGGSCMVLCRSFRIPFHHAIFICALSGALWWGIVEVATRIAILVS